VLRKTRGVIEGPHGAAHLLDLKPSTARFRIKKLGIRREEFTRDSY
jgi:transcriptional regulator with GAF, ATPase, and Fis domain